MRGRSPGSSRNGPAPRRRGKADADAWWKDFHDPLLNALVEEMLSNSPTLKEAHARLAEAWASREAVRGGTLPQAQLSGSANEIELSRNGQLPIGSIPGFARDFGLFDAGFDASWEIDLWGHGRRQIEAADARNEQAQMSAQGVRLQLIAELARAYVDLRLGAAGGRAGEGDGGCAAGAGRSGVAARQCRGRQSGRAGARRIGPV